MPQINPPTSIPNNYKSLILVEPEPHVDSPLSEPQPPKISSTTTPAHLLADPTPLLLEAPEPVTHATPQPITSQQLTAHSTEKPTTSPQSLYPAPLSPIAKTAPLIQLNPHQATVPLLTVTNKLPALAPKISETTPAVLADKPLPATPIITSAPQSEEIPVLEQTHDLRQSQTLTLDEPTLPPHPAQIIHPPTAQEIAQAIHTAQAEHLVSDDQITPLGEPAPVQLKPGTDSPFGQTIYGIISAVLMISLIGLGAFIIIRISSGV